MLLDRERRELPVRVGIVPDITLAPERGDRTTFGQSAGAAFALVAITVALAWHGLNRIVQFRFERIVGFAAHAAAPRQARSMSLASFRPGGGRAILTRRP